MLLARRPVLAAALAALALAPAAAQADPPADLPTYEVGIGTQSIAVNADGSFGGGRVYLGGYGVGGATVLGDDYSLGSRYATGNLGVGPSVRAFVVGDGKNVFAIADAELQGWFAAAKDGPFGIMDVRRAVAAQTRGAIPADHVVVQSDHSHGGPDLLGVWGGATTAYRQYVVDQTVKAIVDAWRNRQSGSLWYGTAPGRDLLSNQFDYDAANRVMDSDVRVLQARDEHGRPFATMLNFSAHSTVLDDDNTRATGDWPQQANPMLEKAFGGSAMTVVGTLGRSQPADRSDCGDQKVEANALCTLDAYASRVVDRAKDAVKDAQPLTGKAEVVTNSYLITDPGSSPLLLGMLYGGAPLGMPVNRAMTPPFMTGNVIGTVTTSTRIGDVLLSSGPGEMYPQIPLKVRGEAVANDLKIRGFMTAGLAEDQLGYLIAPFQSYPEPVRRSFFNREGDQVSPLDNDNYFFNVSHTMGERVTCSLLRGAGEAFGAGSALRDSYDRCQAFADDAVLPPGSDVTAADATKDAPPIPSGFPPAGR